MKYQIIGEGHEGVCSYDDEVFDIIDANSEYEALIEYSKRNLNVYRYNESFCIGNGMRRLTAKKLI